jgi:GTPase SAR1 family protein
MKKIYPFKFLDSYQREDKDFFYGRETEIELLYQMIFQTKILLIYGTSGTGKTSLIQCGLANKFQTYDWLSLYIRRGTNLLASLDKVLCHESDDVFVYEEQNELKIKDLHGKIEAVYKATFKPIYLMFDQFEELYILGTKDEQTQFIKTIQEILAVEQPVKVILSIREEYLGYLYEFEKEVPQLINKKLRVEPMNQLKVEEVIKSICSSKQSLISLKTGEEDEIVKAIYKKISGDEKNASIQLPYLQVFLDSFYLKITNDETRKPEAVFTLEALNKIGNIGDVLRNFLDEQVLTIANKLDQKPETIWKILKPFVTLDGTKEPLSIEKLSEQLTNEPKEIIEKALNAFVNSRILRFTETNQLYEIAHDSLAKQINTKRSDEEIAVLEVKRLIKSQVAVKNEAREYFTEKQILFIEPYLNKFKISDEEQEWLNKSSKLVKKQKRNKFIKIGIGALALFVALSITALIFKVQELKAQQDKVNAQVNELAINDLLAIVMAGRGKQYDNQDSKKIIDTLKREQDRPIEYLIVPRATSEAVEGTKDFDYLIWIDVPSFRATEIKEVIYKWPCDYFIDKNLVGTEQSLGFAIGYRGWGICPIINITVILKNGKKITTEPFDGQEYLKKKK